VQNTGKGATCTGSTMTYDLNDITVSASSTDATSNGAVFQPSYSHEQTGPAYSSFEEEWDKFMELTSEILLYVSGYMQTDPI